MNKENISQEGEQENYFSESDKYISKLDEYKKLSEELSGLNLKTDAKEINEKQKILNKLDKEIEDSEILEVLEKLNVYHYEAIKKGKEMQKLVVGSPFANSEQKEKSEEIINDTDSKINEASKKAEDDIDSIKGVETKNNKKINRLKKEIQEINEAVQGNSLDKYSSEKGFSFQDKQGWVEKEVSKKEEEIKQEKNKEKQSKVDKLKKEIEEIDKAVQENNLDKYSSEKGFSFQDKQKWAEKEVSKKEEEIYRVENVDGKIASKKGKDEAEEKKEQKTKSKTEKTESGDKKPTEEDRQEEKAKKENIKKIFNDFSDKFNISKKDLESLEGYKNLSVGQKGLLLENFKQYVYGEIKEDASNAYNEGLKKSGFFKRIIKGIAKTYYIAKEEKIKGKEITESGIDKYKIILEQFINRMNNGSV